MPMVKFARALVVDPRVTGRSWTKVRRASTASTDVNENLITRASDIFGKSFDPKDYLLTHASIVASVDTEEPPGVKTGSVMEGGFRVNRKYLDYRVAAGHDKYINNNLDFWSRGTLLKSFRTFIGGQNFVEHVQVEDLSKGRIIDAVARDIGDSVYVDILIATDRKHTDMVTAIGSGKMSTLSMGCTIDGSSCTKCGHWAADETEQCACIKYEKGNTFFDKQGRQHRVAEQCGNVLIDPTGGVTFIEASWVGTPAFTGAVLRNVIEMTPALAEKAATILAQPPAEWSSETRQKAASLAFRSSTFMAGWDDDDGDDEGGDDDEDGDDDASEGGPFEDMEKDLTDHMRDRVKKKIKKDMDQDDLDGALGPDTSSAAPNDDLVKQGACMMGELVPETHDRLAYGGALTAICRTASCDADILNRVASLNTKYGVKIPVPLYRVALRLGSVNGYGSLNRFVQACQAALGRKPTTAEAMILIRLGKLIPLRDQARSGSNPTPGSRPSEGDTR